MEIRPPKPDDQEKCEIAFNLLKEMVLSNPEIDVNVWIGACFSAIAGSFNENGSSYSEYFMEMLQAACFYKSYWED